MNTIKIGKIRKIKERGFDGGVYRRPDYHIGEAWSDDRTGENPAAHGWVIETEEESIAGRQRMVAVNGSHREIGPWSPTREQREKHALVEVEAAKKKQEAEEDRLAIEAGIQVGNVCGKFVEIRHNGDMQKIAISDIQAGAKDPWNPRLRLAQALASETPEDRRIRLVYRSILRKMQKGTGA